MKLFKAPLSAPLSACLDFAETLADAAAAISLPLFRSGLDVHNKARSGFDPVTIADQAVEARLRELIGARYPTHSIHGEEGGMSGHAGGWTWVLDPIDGTRSYICGIPMWGTLIALNDGNRPVLGVMDQPFTKERYVGLAGHAWLNDVAIRTRQCSALSSAHVMCTTPDMFSQADELAAFQALASQVAFVRYGGASYGYCMVASGHVDAVIEAGLQPYDIQALIPIIEGAGGVVTTWDGGDAQQGGKIVASGDARLHGQILAVLAGQ